MYAVIKTGGKQYKVSPGDVIEVEHLKVKGADPTVTLTPLLVVTDKGETVIGAKQLAEFPVSAKVLGDTKGDKLTVFKYRPKSGYASKNGHRQLLSLIQVTAIGEAKAEEIVTAEDVQPETTGPQKPAPVLQKKETAEEADEAASPLAGQQAEAAPAMAEQEGRSTEQAVPETPPDEPRSSTEQALAGAKAAGEGAPTEQAVAEVQPDQMGGSSQEAAAGAKPEEKGSSTAQAAAKPEPAGTEVWGGPEQSQD